MSLRLLSFAFLASITAFAQEYRATISGRVTDPRVALSVLLGQWLVVLWMWDLLPMRLWA